VHATYADVGRHPNARLVPGLLILRLDAPLYFFNSSVARRQILDLVAAAETQPRGIVLEIGASSDLDVTTADMLQALVKELRSRFIEVLFAQVKGAVRDRMRRTGLMELVGEDRIYLSIAAAVEDYRSWPA